MFVAINKLADHEVLLLQESAARESWFNRTVGDKAGRATDLQTTLAYEKAQGDQRCGCGHWSLGTSTCLSKGLCVSEFFLFSWWWSFVPILYQRCFNSGNKKKHYVTLYEIKAVFNVLRMILYTCDLLLLLAIIKIGMCIICEWMIHILSKSVSCSLCLF